MKNLVNEQQVQNKSNRKEVLSTIWKCIKWVIKIACLIIELVEYFEGGDK